MAMTIRKRVRKAMMDMAEKDYENAMIQAVIAMDGTAKKEGIKAGNAERCKAFFKNNRDIISRSTFDLLEIHGEFTFNYTDSSGVEQSKNFEEVIYHLIRCTILHEGDLPEEIEFLDEQKIGVSEVGKIILPNRLVFGFVMAVVGSPANKDERLVTDLSFNLDQERFYINELWGKKEKILRIFRESAEKKTHTQNN